MNELVTTLLSTPKGTVYLFYAGQAGFIVKSASGETLAIDLYLSDCGERIEGHIGFKRLFPSILSPKDMVLDYIVATHFHFDHFDIESIPIMMSNNRTRLFAAKDCIDFVQKTNIDKNRVCYVSPSESYKAGDYALHFVNCDHGTLAPKAVGVVIEVSEKRILIVGDTCLRLDWKDMYLSKGPIDIMIAPINGAYGNLNESDCAELSKAISPQLTIPCHYGLFATHKGLPGLFIEEMNAKCPQNQYMLMTVGECLKL